MSKWYSNKRLFSYNAFINFCLGQRGGGKSYNAKQTIIENYLKKGEEAAYVRRSMVELDEVKDTYWNDIRDAYPDLELTVKGRIGYINNKPVVYFIPLSTSSKMKSASFPNVSLLVFDEYIITTTSHVRYLKNEAILLLDLIETIFRLRENVKVLILSNSVSYVNPLFTYWDIDIDDSKRFNVFKEGLVVVELYNNEQYVEEKKNTKFGRLIQDTAYGSYAIDNNVLEDNEEFICKRPKGSLYFVCALKFNEFEVGVWLHNILGTYFIDEKIDTNSKNKYYLKNDDIKNGFISIKTDRASWRIKKTKQAFHNGELYFETQEIKKLFIDSIIKYL